MAADWLGAEPLELCPAATNELRAKPFSSSEYLVVLEASGCDAPVCTKKRQTRTDLQTGRARESRAEANVFAMRIQKGVGHRTECRCVRLEACWRAVANPTACRYRS